MRLKRLDLTRYGKFTDQSLDFGECAPGQPDFHIVYGPNEAGKSTAFAAFLDLLFGIEMRSRFNFLHPYPVMRIGASVQCDGAVHELIRIKRQQNSLLDSHGQAIAEAVISGQLGSIDRDSYRSMFSLDDETLEEGGESILASKGDLGQLLFAASTGLANLSHTLADLRAEADGFYKYHARGGALSALKARLLELKDERDKIDTVASTYAHLIETRDRALAHYNEAMAERTRIQGRMEEIGRLVAALPRLASLRALRLDLQPLVDLPTPPPGWHALLPALRTEEIELSTRRESTDQEVEGKTTELDTVVVDDAILAQADRIDRLDHLYARYLTAEKDIPARQAEIHEVDVVIARVLNRLGREADPDPSRLVLNAPTVGVLQDLIAKQSGIDAALEAATRELADAQMALEMAQAKLPNALGTISGDTAFARVARVVASLRDNDHAVRRRLAERACAAHAATLADRLRALHPWTGNADQLDTITVPESGQVAQWKVELATAQAAHDTCQAEAERLKTEHIRLEAERNTIQQQTGLTTEGDAAAIRSERESAWASHRRTLDPVSADAFEAALRRDDLVTSARLQHETDIARLHQISLRLSGVETDAGRAQEILAAASAKEQRIRSEIDSAMCPILPAGSTLIQLDAWLARRERALETRALLKAAERDRHAAEEDAEDARTRLRTALNAAGVTTDVAASIDTLQTLALAELDREAEAKALREAVEQRQRDVTVRERNHATATGRTQAWQQAWQAACAQCWLADLGPLPTTAAVREILIAVSAIGPALEKRAGLLDRIAKMQDDQAAFAQDVAAVAGLLGIPPDTTPPLDLARTLKNGVQAARAAQSMRTTLTRALDDARLRQRELAQARAIHDRRKAEMTAFFNVGSLTDVAVRLSEVEQKARLEKDRDAATRDILDALRLASIDAAEAVLDTVDRAVLESELAELKARFDDQDQRTRDLFTAHSKAVDQVEAVGGDAAVARIEETRRTTLLEIEDGAVRYLKLRVGIVAAEHALRAYRQQHRSSMMAHASEAFRTISRDAYSRLASQPNKDSEILIAVAADGSSKVASELSKGTRFQLYLALRVAGYHEFARLRSPVPFVADDIMETFDDFRAEEALKLLSSMSEVGQVIYLTHHRHLCDIARRVCPGVRIHDISTPPS